MSKNASIGAFSIFSWVRYFSRIKAINQSEYSWSIVGTDSVPEIDSLKSIKNFVFRIDADTPQLRNAVENCLEKLRINYPDYNFSATYGGN